MKKIKHSSNNVPPAPLSKLRRALPWILVVCGAIGLFASFILTTDTISSLQNPHFQPACDLNPIVSCGSVMKSGQADVFGFINPIVGLAGFPILITIGAAMLAGAQFKRWFWRGIQVGLTLGIAFAYWMLAESIFRIQALCPYCLSVDAVMTTAFWYITLYNFNEGNIGLPAQLRPWGRFVKRHHIDIIVAWFLVILVIILNHFWYYFGQHI